MKHLGKVLAVATLLYVALRWLQLTKLVPTPLYSPGWWVLEILRLAVEVGAVVWVFMRLRRIESVLAEHEIRFRAIRQTAMLEKARLEVDELEDLVEL